MLRNITLIFLSLMLCSLLHNCASAPQVLEARAVRNQLQLIKQEILHDRNYLIKLKDLHIAKSGFYYIVNLDGIVVFHPQALLIGRNFKDYAFIQKILEKGDGCVTYLIGGEEHIILFERLNNWEILCLSIDKKQIKGVLPNCEFLNKSP